MKRFAEITARYVGKPFKQYNCMGFLFAIYTDLGIAVPHRFEHLTLDNYMSHFVKDPYHTQVAMLRLVRSLGRPSTATCPHLGDLLVVAQPVTRKNVVRPGLFAGIYTGRGQAMTSFFRKGVSVFKLDRLNKPVVARRMI